MVGGDNGDEKDDGILNVFGGENVLWCGCFLGLEMEKYGNRYKECDIFLFVF